MEIREAQNIVDKQIMSYGGYWRLMSEYLRLVEELGELSRVVNIKYGDKRAKSLSDGRELQMELVDVFYTSLAIANSHSIDLSSEILNQINISDQEVTIEKIQTKLLKNKKQEIPFLNILSKLIRKVGNFAILAENPNEEKIKSSITDIVIATIEISAILEIDLSTEFENKVEADESKIKKVYPASSMQGV